MSVRPYKTKHGERWEYVLELPRGPDGKRRQVRRAGFASRELAEAARQAEQVDRRRGIWVDPPSATLAEWLEEWLLDAAETVRPSTAGYYASIARNHLVPTLGDVRMKDLNAVQIQGALRLLGRERTPTTVNAALAILNTALRRAVALGVLPRNPAEHVRRRAAEPVRAQRAWSADEARAFLARVDAAGDPLRACWRLMLDAGLRPGEALALQWPDVDLEAGTIRVRRTVTRDAAGALLLGRTTKTGKERTVGLAPETVAALRAHRQEQRERKLRLRPVWQDLDLVFDGGRGQLLSGPALHHRFLKAQAGLGLPRLTPHGLRHTCATLLVLHGLPLTVVQRRLGHASITITSDTYAHVGPAADRLASAAMGAILAPERAECEGFGEGKA